MSNISPSIGAGGATLEDYACKPPAGASARGRERLAHDAIGAAGLREALEGRRRAVGARDVAAAVLRDEVLGVERHKRVAVVATVVLAVPRLGPLDLGLGLDQPG